MQVDKINVMYLRLSLEDNDVVTGSDNESCSIGSQRRCINNFIKSDDSLSANTFEEFIDDGFSGTSMNRPSIKRLLRLVDEGKVSTIIVRDLSRFSRDYLEAGHFLEFVFPAYNVRFISINDGFDSGLIGEDTGGLELAIQNLINNMYSIETSRRIKSVVDLKKYNGEFVYGTAPYGYKKGERKNTIVVDEEAAIIVRKIFDMASNGISITKIAQYLNDNKVPTPSMHLSAVRSKKYKVRTFWSFESVFNIIDNRIYTGDTEPFKSHVIRVGSNKVKMIPKNKREVLMNTHDAIVSREIYFSAQKIINGAPKGKRSDVPRPLSKLLVCGCCGNKLQKGRAANHNWSCATARYTTETGCKDIKINEEKLTGIIINAINTQCLLLNEEIKQTVSMHNSYRNESDIIVDELSIKEKRLDKIQAEKMNCYEDYIRGALSKEDFIKVKNTLSKEEETIKLEVNLLKDKLSSLSNELKIKQANVRKNRDFLKYQGVTILTEELISELIKRIVVLPNNEIKIEWNFSEEQNKTKENVAS